MTQDSIESNFTSMHAMVEFVDVLEQYPLQKDLHCKLKFNDYVPQEGDKVALFKLGWSSVKDFVVCERAPSETCNGYGSVTFNGHVLPKCTSEMYQLCYLGNKNELHGASTPFQMHPDLLNSACFLPLKNDHLSDITTQSQAKDDEIKRLKEENALLKDTLKQILSDKSADTCKNYDKDIKEVRDVVENLQCMLLKHEKEIETLKDKVREGGEEYRKLYLERLKIERKYQKLKRKRKAKSEETPPIVEELSFDLGDLKSIPPFPSDLSLNNK